MKILLTIHEKFLPDSGSAGSTFRLGEEYQRMGHDVYFFSLDDMPKLQRQVKRFMFPEFVALHINKLYKREGLDIVDSSPGDNWIWGLLSQNLGRNRPLVVTRSHGLQHLESLWHKSESEQGHLQLSWFYSLYRGGYLLWEIANSFRNADLAFFLNHQEAIYAEHNLRICRNKIHIFPNGMSDSFIGLPFDSSVKNENNIIRIAQIGTYIQRKGIEYSVSAFRNILKRYSNVQISFIGTGFPKTGSPEERVYKDFDISFHSRIKVIPAYKNEMLPILLEGHHINVFSSLSEGFGKTLIEAMACGLAPVTTDADGPMEIVTHDYDALVIPQRDAKAIERAVEVLIENTDLLNKIRGNAYRTAQKYSWSSVAKQRFSAYENALNSKSLE